MPSVPIVRVHYLLPFLGVLRGIGAPVDRELARAKLPACVEEAPDAYNNRREATIMRTISIVKSCLALLVTIATMSNALAADSKESVWAIASTSKDKSDIDSPVAYTGYADEAAAIVRALRQDKLVAK